MNSSMKIMNKRRSIVLAEVDLVNSNAFKQTQLNLEKQNVRLDKNHTESMLLHNREYGELKRFLNSIRAVDSHDEPCASAAQGAVAATSRNVARAVTAPNKDSLALLPEDGSNKHPTRPNTVAERPNNQRANRQRSVSDGARVSKDGEAKNREDGGGAVSEPASPRKGSLTGHDHQLPRLTLLASSPIPENQPSWKQSRRSAESPPQENASKDTRKSHMITLEFNMKGGNGGRRLSRSTSLDGQLSVPTRKPIRSPVPEANNNQQKHLSSSLPLPSNRASYTAPSLKFLHPKGPHSDPSCSSSSRSSSPMTGVPSRRHSMIHPISSTSIRKSVELSEGFTMDTKAYDPSIHADVSGRRFSSDDGTPSAPAARSLLQLKPKVSHAKSMEVMVASQKQILQRRKTLSQLNTRLLTAGECIEIQNKRRDRMHGSRTEDAVEKGGVWSKEPFFVNRQDSKPTRKNSVTDNKDKE